VEVREKDEERSGACHPTPRRDAAGPPERA